MATQSALQAIANEIDTYPNGRETANMAGIKTKATARNATVVVYPVPVDFWWASNIALLVRWDGLRKVDQIG